MLFRKSWAVWPLLDTAFGFFVWAAHLLAIYITTAIACVLGLGASSAATRTALIAGLVLGTLAATALVAVHAVRRYRSQRNIPDQRFRLAVTIGNDGIAIVAIAWQILVLTLVPACR